MHMKKQNLCVVLFHMIAISEAILVEEIGKDLPSNYNNNDILSRRRIPFGGGGLGGGGSSGCNFNGIRRPKGAGSGRTFFDLQFINVGYHENYEINCGGTGGHQPAAGAGSTGLGGGHKPLLGGHGGGGSDGGHGGLFSNKPSKPFLSMIFANRPLQGLFSQSQSQSQSQTGILGDALSGFTSLLPKPQDIGQGLGDGISSFIQTLPQIGQSFQSLLPSFENFQLPSLPSLPPFVQAGSQSMSVSGPSPTTNPPAVMVTPAAPDLVTEPTIDPDDIIYNDDVKPVHEDPDVAGPHTTNKLPPGAYFNRHYAQNRYQSYKNYQDQKINAQRNQNRYHYQQSTPSYGQREPRLRANLDVYSESERPPDHFYNERSGSRRFRFPT